MNNKTDQIYRNEHGMPGSFRFDSRVAEVFNDMISRSVPGYRQILEMLPTLTRQFRSKHGRYYDLGCSLGAGMLAMAEGLTDKQFTLIGIDNSAAMIEQATLNLNGLNAELHTQDLIDTTIDNATIVLMNFTLQFIPIADRALVIDNIYRGLNKGGVFILSEKIMFSESQTNQALIDIHHQYKADQGYSKLEIAQKRDAIENVLIPETLDTHTQRLRDAGFSVITPWVQNLQFISILAIK